MLGGAAPFDVAGIQRTAAVLCTLRLVATPSNVDVVQSAAFAAASRRLADMHGTAHAPCAHEDMITWRPTHCVDVCLVPDAARGVLVYVLQHEGPGGRTRETVPYAAAEPLPFFLGADVFFCAHVTVDRTDDGDGNMVVLVYDSFRAGAGAEPCAERYARVQQAVHAWRCSGHTHVVPQWVGDPSSRDELEQLDLPHARACIVVLTHTGGYFRLPEQPKRSA